MCLSDHQFIYQILIFYQCDWLIISILILICFINMYYPDSASWIITIYFIITHPFIIYFLIWHIFFSGLPTTMTDVMGVPATAGLPKNLSELAVFNGMPLEHANRVVSTYVLRGIWDVYLYNVLLVAEYERFEYCFSFFSFSLFFLVSSTLAYSSLSLPPSLPQLLPTQGLYRP